MIRRPSRGTSPPDWTHRLSGSTRFGASYAVALASRVHLIHARCPMRRPRAPGTDQTERLPPLLRGRLRRWLRAWSALWGDRDRLSDVSITVNPALRRSWARAYPKTRRLVLSPAALKSSPRVLRAVVCHEAAHLFLFEGRPHGTEWKQLVEAAGAPASVSMSDVGADVHPSRPAVWIHRCPVCQMSRVGRRHVSQWRCAACVAGGLPGHLVAERVLEGT